MKRSLRIYIMIFKNTERKIIGALALIIISSFMFRVINIHFPAFTAEEARIAARGYTLSYQGTDELGRRFPIIFNSLKDYQLPLTSYLTASGVLIFGKTDVGARMPFIIIGTLIVFLTYKVSSYFREEKKFRLLTAGIMAFSPALIFLSKTPNESIVLTFLLLLLFYFLLYRKSRMMIVVVFILAILTSKIAWFILLPFLFFTSWLLKNNSKRFFFSLVLLIVMLAFFLFLTIPQSKRSLSENNFSLFSNITIKNGIDRLRGQGIQSGWNQFVDRILFNKSHFLTVGLIHWFSHLNPSLYFGQIDEEGEYSLSHLGAWPKIFLLPFLVGIFLISRNGNKKHRLFLFLFLVLTFPSFLIYPNLTLDVTILTLPFMAMVIALGFVQIVNWNKKVAYAGFTLAILELVINLCNLSPEYKNTNTLRPNWIQPVVISVFKTSKINKTAISDDIVSDIIPFIDWYTPKANEVNNLGISWPYKFRQYNLPNIKIIGSDEKFRTCGKDEKLSLFVSNRDMNKVKGEFHVQESVVFKDNLNNEKAYLLAGEVCLN